MRSLSEEKIKDILEFVEKFFEEHQCSPSMKEIGDSLGMTKSNVHTYLHRMEERGMLRMDRRGVVTNGMERRYGQLNIPIVGTIACGVPMFAEENIDGYVALPESFVGKGDFFILKASGKSMINAGIDDEDLVVVRKQNSAEDGDIVCALVGDESTLKRYHVNDTASHIELIAENDDKDTYPNIIPKEGVIVQGVYIGVIRLNKRKTI